jgi:hypothetical protein
MRAGRQTGPWADGGLTDHFLRDDGLVAQVDGIQLGVGIFIHAADKLVDGGGGVNQVRIQGHVCERCRAHAIGGAQPNALGREYCWHRLAGKARREGEEGLPRTVAALSAGDDVVFVELLCENELDQDRLTSMHSPLSTMAT